MATGSENVAVPGMPSVDDLYFSTISSISVHLINSHVSENRRPQWKRDAILAMAALVRKVASMNGILLTTASVQYVLTFEQVVSRS